MFINSSLDKIIFIPTGISHSQKILPIIIHEIAAIAGFKKLEFQMIEILKSFTSKEKSYTVNTMNKIYKLICNI